MLGVGASLWQPVRARGASFSPASLFTGGIAGGFWPNNDLTAFKTDSAGTVQAAVGDPVGYHADRSGNGNHLVQATTSRKPILRQTGGIYWLEFDGIDDYLTVAFPVAIPQPFDRIHVSRLATQAGYVLDSSNFDAGALGFFSGATQIRNYFSATFGALVAYPTATVQIVDESLPGTLRVGANSGASSAGTASLAGLTVGSGGASFFANPSAVNWFGGLVRAGALTAQQRTDYRAYLAASTGAVA